jgi:hypothetical protein
MNHRRLAMALLVCLLGCQVILAEDFEYDGKKVGGVKFDKDDECAITLDNNSIVKGVFNRPKGTIDISVENGSALGISGECRRVVITNLDKKSKIDLTRLKVGAGGVLIVRISGSSRLATGQCAGKIDIRMITGTSVLSYKKGTKIEGEKNVTAPAKIVMDAGKANEGFHTIEFADKLIRYKVVGAGSHKRSTSSTKDKCTVTLSAAGSTWTVTVTKKAIEYKGKTVPLQRTAKKIEVIAEVGEEARILVDGRQVYPNKK